MRLSPHRIERAADLEGFRGEAYTVVGSRVVEVFAYRGTQLVSLASYDGFLTIDALAAELQRLVELR